MPTYEYRCPQGHITERVQPMTAALPATVRCEATTQVSAEETLLADFAQVLDDRGFDLHAIDVAAPDPEREAFDVLCLHDAERVFSPPAAIHFKGNGFYSTDVKGRQERRRRPNAADSLHRPHDEAASRIARSL